MVTINIGRKEAVFFAALVVIFLGIGFGIAYGGNQPDLHGHDGGELKDVCLKDGTNCPDFGTDPVHFVIDYDSGNTGSSRTCVTYDLEDYCGDRDGCTIKYLIQNFEESNDEVSVIDSLIYMEQQDISPNNRPGDLRGRTQTRQDNHGRIWSSGGTTRDYIDIVIGGVWVTNYVHDDCQGQAGHGPAFTNPYEFSFMSHENIRSEIFIYD